MITINTINNSWYFIEDFVIKPNSSEEFDESLLSFEQTRDLLNAQINDRISLSVQDKTVLQERLELLDGHLSQNELKTINGISLVGTGDVSVGSSQATTDLESACHISGGDITILSGNNFSISSGVGYARNPSGDLVRITWNAVPTIATQYGGANYVGFDYNSQPVFSNQPLSSEYCPVGYVFTTNNNTAVIGFANVRLTGKDSLYRLGDLFRNTIGTLVESGVSTAMKPAPEELQLVISQGTVWYLLNKYEISQTDQFTKLYQNAEGFGVDTSDPNTINFMDYSDVSLSGNSLINMSVGYYKKDMVVVTPSNKAYYIYATTQWPTIEEAKEAPLPDVPDSIRNSVVRSAALIIEQSTLGVIEVLDIRPMFTKLFETGSAASNATVISHSDLTDLSNDDHTQYHTDARGDVRYYRKSEVDTLIGTKADTTHTHTAATTSNSGFMSASDKVKLDSIQAGANQNSTDAFLLNRANHTGTQPSNTISDLAATVTTLINNRITDQVIDGDTVTAPTQNAVFDALANKANSIHTHSTSQITDFNASVDSRINTRISSTSIDELNDVNTTNKSNGQVLTYNTVTSQWSPATPIVYGDMFKSTYDTNDNGVIDNSERLNNQLPTYYLSRTNHTGTQLAATVSDFAPSVRSTALTGFSPTNSPIISTDSVLQAFGKAQGQIDGLSIVSDKTLLHRTLTKFYERKNSGNLSPFDINLRGLFETNYIIPANTLTAGDSFRIEFEVFFYSATVQIGNYGFAPIINGAVVPISAEGAVSLGILATHQHIRGRIDFTCFSAGASGVFGFDGYAQGRNGAIYPYSEVNATYNTTADITVNMSVRFTSAPGGANTARVVFGRLYKISN